MPIHRQKQLTTVRYSRPATPGDNPVNEAFFSHLKAERGSNSWKLRPSTHCINWSAGLLPITTRKGIIRVLSVKHPLSLPNNSLIISHLKVLKWFPKWGPGAILGFVELITS